MDETISATEANRAFSRLLRRVREERKSFIVTSHGQRGARLMPCQPEDAHRQAARSALLRRLAEQPATDMGRWRRDELHAR